MSLWTMIFLLGIAGMIFAVWVKMHDAKNGIVRNSRGDPVTHTPRERELEDEVEKLRNRIHVLERIATDPAKRTAEEIEQLRNERD